MPTFRDTLRVCDDHRVFEVAHDREARRVEAWSETRLPFEPRGAALEFRGQLRTALTALRPRSGEVLHAVYTSKSERFVDAENVLLYNVGAAALRGACTHGLCFERRFAVPPAAPTPGWVPAHHHRYAFAAEGTASTHWTRVRRLAWWPETPLAAAAFSTPAPAWLAARRTVQVDGRTAAPGSFFELRLRVRGRVSPASAVKPLFDGVIAALHAHDGTAQEEVVRRLGGALRGDPSDLAALLSGAAPLGVRTLVRLRGAGLQWNPEDERCVLGGLASTLGAPSFSGEVWEVVPSVQVREGTTLFA